MKDNLQMLVIMMAIIGWTTPSLASDDMDGINIFEQKCKVCHTIDRKKLALQFLT